MKKTINSINTILILSVVIFISFIVMENSLSSAKENIGFKAVFYVH